MGSRGSGKPPLLPPQTLGAVVGPHHLPLRHQEWLWAPADSLPDLGVVMKPPKFQSLLQAASTPITCPKCTPELPA